jgi:hypothetical protein
MCSFSSQRNENVRSTLVVLQSQLSVIMNMLVSVFAMFGVGYYVGVQYQYPVEKRFICGLFGAIIILFVEMALYIIRAMQNDGKDIAAFDALSCSHPNKVPPMEPWDFSKPRQDDDLNLPLPGSFDSKKKED